MRCDLDLLRCLYSAQGTKRIAFRIRATSRPKANHTMSRLLLVPLEDVVVFPTMNLTLTVDVGDEQRVLLVPRHENEFANVGTVADVSERVRLPGGGHAVVLSGLHRGVAGAAHTAPDGKLHVEVEERPDAEPVDGTHARAGARVPRRRRGDPRAARRRRPHPGVRALDQRARHARRHVRLLARPRLRAEGRAAGDARRDRAARAGRAAAARAARRAAGAQAHPRRRRVRRREAAARVLPAQTDGLDPQGARRGRRVRRRGVPHEDRRGRHARRRRASRPSGSWAGSSAWASSRARRR